MLWFPNMNDPGGQAFSQSSIDVPDHGFAGCCVHFDFIFRALLVLIFDVIDVDALKNAAVVPERPVDIVHIESSGGLFSDQLLKAGLGGDKRLFTGNADGLCRGDGGRDNSNPAENCGCH